MHPPKGVPYMPYKIAILSDTHNLLRDELKLYLQSCDRILHAGDIAHPSILEELSRFATTCAVRGNADKEWAKGLPETLVIDDIGIRIFMIHNKKQIKEDTSAYDLIVYGHSHKYEEKIIDGTTWLNPGSCGPRRFRLPITMALLHVEDDGSFRIERLDIPHPEVREDDTVTAATVKEHLPAIIREIEKGTPVKSIAGKFHLSKELAEQICRLYLTHPGIDADGIMSKLGL